MVEASLRTAPVPAEPAVFPGVTITLAAPSVRYSLRARDAKLLGKLLGRKLPATIGQVEGDVACLGPDEWLLRTGADARLPDSAGQPVSVVEISERAITLVIEGPQAEAVLAAGCPRDLARFAVGQARRTVFEGVEIILWRSAVDRFEVDVWRSFAPWLHLALTKVASHLA